MNVRVLVGVNVGVYVRVLVGVYVLVGVRVSVGVDVYVRVKVAVRVGVFVRVLVGVLLGVRVRVLVGVLLGVRVRVLVAVGVSVRVPLVPGVSVAVGVDVLSVSARHLMTTRAAVAFPSCKRQDRALTTSLSLSIKTMPDLPCGNGLLIAAVLSARQRTLIFSGVRLPICKRHAPLFTMSRSLAPSRLTYLSFGAACSRVAPNSTALNNTVHHKAQNSFGGICNKRFIFDSFAKWGRISLRGARGYVRLRRERMTNAATPTATNTTAPTITLRETKTFSFALGEGSTAIGWS